MKETIETLRNSFGREKMTRTLMPTPSPIMSAYHVPPHNFSDKLPNCNTNAHGYSFANTTGSSFPQYCASDNYIPPLPPPVTPVGLQSGYPHLSRPHSLASGNNGPQGCDSDNYVPPLPSPVAPVSIQSGYPNV